MSEATTYPSTGWGPSYWMFLHTVARTYPSFPNEVTRRKYYDLIHSFPLFIPDADMGNRFSYMLDRFPVTPYLASRDSFMRWVHYMHNRYNHLQNKEEISYERSLELYDAQYLPKPVIMHDVIRWNEHYLYITIMGILLGSALIANYS